MNSINVLDNCRLNEHRLNSLMRSEASRKASSSLSAMLEHGTARQCIVPVGTGSNSLQFFDVC
jgi:hypothetical protein